MQNAKLKFKELKITGKEAPWCVDGRKAKQASKGPQMLGGSLHPLVLAAVLRNSLFDQQFITDNISTLKNAGFGIGVHRGSHKHEDRSDCAFSDNLPRVFEKAISQQDEITRRMKTVYDENSKALGKMPKDIFKRAFKMIKAYSLDNIQLSGEKLIALVANLGAQVIDLEGEHVEQTAFVNLKKGTTFDTNAADDSNEQAFNLDLWSALDQTQALGVDKDFATTASLILYQATEMVLVEDKGKKRLSVVLHN